MVTGVDGVHARRQHRAGLSAYQVYIPGLGYGKPGLVLVARAGGSLGHDMALDADGGEPHLKILARGPGRRDQSHRYDDSPQIPSPSQTERIET